MPTAAPKVVAAPRPARTLMAEQFYEPTDHGTDAFQTPPSNGPAPGSPPARRDGGGTRLVEPAGHDSSRATLHLPGHPGDAGRVGAGGGRIDLRPHGAPGTRGERANPSGVDGVRPRHGSRAPSRIALQAVALVSLIHPASAGGKLLVRAPEFFTPLRCGSGKVTRRASRSRSRTARPTGRTLSKV